MRINTQSLPFKMLCFAYMIGLSDKAGEAKFDLNINRSIEFSEDGFVTIEGELDFFINSIKDGFPFTIAPMMCHKGHDGQLFYGLSKAFPYATDSDCPGDYAPITNAPYLQFCPVVFECAQTTLKRNEYGFIQAVTAEIVNVSVEESVVEDDGNIDLARMLDLCFVKEDGVSLTAAKDDLEQDDLEAMVDSILQEVEADGILDHFQIIDFPEEKGEELLSKGEKKKKQSNLQRLIDKFELLKDSYSDDNSSVLEILAQKIVIPVLKLDIDEGCRMWEYLLRHYYGRIPAVYYHDLTDEIIEHAEYDTLVSVFSSSRYKNQSIRHYVFRRDPYDNHYYCERFIHKLILQQEYSLADSLISSLLQNNTPSNNPQKNLYDLLYMVLNESESRWLMSSSGIDYVSSWIPKVDSEMKRAELEVLLMDLVDVVENDAPKGDIPFSLFALEGGPELFMKEIQKQHKSTPASYDADEEICEIQKQNKSTPDLSPDDVMNWYREHETEYRLAQAFATACNKFWRDEDSICDSEDWSFVNGVTNETKVAWQKAMFQLENEIKRILSVEGIEATTRKKWQQALTSFMERNGFQNENGWWAQSSQPPTTAKQ